MIWLLVLVAAYGVLCLVAPPSFFLFGERWQYKNGEDLEPSDAYLAYARTFGVLAIVGSVVGGYFVLRWEHHTARNASIAEAWDITLFPMEEVDLVLDPEVRTTDDFAADQGRVGSDERSYGFERAAVVGVDEVGDLGVAEGELLVGIDISSCEVRALIVQETPDTVHIRVVTTALPAVQIPQALQNVYQDGRTEIERSCVPTWAGAPRLGPNDENGIGYTIVRVPLGSPVGDREVLADAPEPEQGDPDEEAQE